MSLLSRSRDASAGTDDDPAMPLEAHEVPLVEANRGGTMVQVPNFEPKPQELVNAAHLGASEWQRQGRAQPWSKMPPPLETPWSEVPPSRPGLYWFVPKQYETHKPFVVPLAPQLVVVTERTGFLMAGWHSNWLMVHTLNWLWSGPVATPEGTDLERLEVGHG